MVASFVVQCGCHWLTRLDRRGNMPKLLDSIVTIKPISPSVIISLYQFSSVRVLIDERE